MPDARIFIDSNTFLYTFDLAETTKQQIAQRWLLVLAERDLGVTNLQVLNEIASVATRKSSRFNDPFFRIDSFAQFGITPISFDTSLVARRIHASINFSWWDCLLLASALELRCTHFLSEDLQDGQVVEGLTIVDPFAHSPEQILGVPIG
jgi:predicted nucleic acid-binding protein